MIVAPHITQIVDAPSSTTKMKNVERLKELRRLILKHYLEVGRGDTLVVTQQAAEKWLNSSGLPANIAVKHFNAISGIDEHRNVRLLMIIGRTQPGDKTSRAFAETLSGEYIPRVPIGDHGASEQWRFHRVERGIPLRIGGEVSVMNYALPDPMAEAIRHLICEDEQRQAIGRGRWTRRGITKLPLHIVIVANEALMPVDEIVPWKIPAGLVETAMEGVMLASPGDLATLWPDLWTNLTAAKRDLARGVPELAGFRGATYQRKGPKLKRQRGWFDMNVIADPRRWEGWNRLGGLAFFALDAGEG